MEERFTPTGDDNRVPTISRVAGDTIVELVYDAPRREAGLVVSRFNGLWNIEREVRIETGEVLIPYSASNTLLANECVLFASKPEHHGDKAELLSAIEAYLARYVDLSPIFARVAAHYALLSWVHDAFNELPYLRLQGDYGTGKTRGLLAIGLLCYKPFFASGASTVSPIFHILDTFGATLILDEADFRFSDATNELVKILNNGTMRGLPVLRTMQNRHKELNPRAFRVFGPKVVAMRHAYQDEALESRFLSEDMNARRMRADIPIHTPSEFRDEALELRNRLLHFRLTTLFSTKLDPAPAFTDLEPRLNQIALPLLSIVDDAKLRADIHDLLARESADNPRQRRRHLASTVARILREAFAGSDVGTIPVGTIAAQVNDQLGTAARCSTKQIARIVRNDLGLTIRKSNGVHVVSREGLEAVDTLAQRSPLAEIGSIEGTDTHTTATMSTSNPLG